MLYQSGGTGQETIFIVDDVETNRLILEEIIKNMRLCFPIKWQRYPVKRLSLP